MSNSISSIVGFTKILVFGTTLIFFANEVRLEVLSLATKGSSKLAPFTMKLTGSGLDLSDKRVYGK